MFTNESILYPLALSDEKVRLLSHCTGTLLPRRLVLTVQQCCRQRAPILITMNAKYINHHVMIPQSGAPAYGLALHPQSSVCVLKLRHKPSCPNPYACLPMPSEKFLNPIIYAETEAFIVFRSFQLTIQVRTFHCNSKDGEEDKLDDEDEFDDEFRAKTYRKKKSPNHISRIVCFVNKTNVGSGAGLYTRSMSGKMELRGILDKSVRMPKKGWMYEFVDIFELLPWLEQFKHDDVDYFRLMSDIERSKWKEGTNKCSE